MRRVFDIIVLIVLVAGAGFVAYTHQAQARGIVHTALWYVAPCSQPLSYSIGTIDPRFHIATSTLVDDAAEAASIWQKASGKHLFQYKESGGDVTINLVYDQRQRTTDKLATVSAQSDQSKAFYDSLQSQYQSLNAQVTSEQASYQSSLSAYQSARATYNAAVDAANRAGGASPAQYSQIESEKASLSQEFANVQSLQEKMDADITSLNAQADAINQVAAQVNGSIAQYNSVGAAEGEFEEGSYQLAVGIQTISIFEYSSHVQLVRLLAHEMGHALGLDHVAAPQAIMYKINTGTNLSATTDDVAELNRACTSRI